MNRHRIAATGVAVVLLGGLATACSSPVSTAEEQDVVQYTADYPTYRSGAQLVSTADLVVRGTVVASRVEEQHPEPATGADPVANPQAGVDPAEAAAVPPVVVTISTLRVEEVVKGDAAVGDTVEVAQLGGELAGVTYVDKETTTLRADGTDYLVALADHGDAPYDLLNPQQALYVVEGGRLSAVSPENTLSLRTLTEVRKLGVQPLN